MRQAGPRGRRAPAPGTPRAAAAAATATGARAGPSDSDGGLAAAAVNTSIRPYIRIVMSIDLSGSTCPYMFARALARAHTHHPSIHPSIRPSVRPSTPDPSIHPHTRTRDDSEGVRPRQPSVSTGLMCVYVRPPLPRESGLPPIYPDHGVDVCICAWRVCACARLPLDARRARRRATARASRPLSCVRTRVLSAFSPRPPSLLPSLDQLHAPSLSLSLSLSRSLSLALSLSFSLSHRSRPSVCVHGLCILYLCIDV